MVIYLNNILNSWHALVRKPKPKDILKELVQRTKSQVRQLDNMNYRKVKKIFMSGDDIGVDDSSSFDQDDESSSQVCTGCCCLY